MNTNNLILHVDSYKAEGHWEQYPPKTTNIFSYIESRGCKHTNEIMMFGLQYFIKEYLSSPVTKDDVAEAEEIFLAHGGSFNREGWDYIVNHHGGFLPVVIKAVPEGTVLPISNVMLTIENTDPKCYWLPSYMETALLKAVWYPSTVASNSFYLKQKIHDAMLQTSDNPNDLDFKLHSFGFRGCSSLESVGIGDMGHLVSFKGTDSMPGVTFARKYYNAQMAGFSIKASEHSTQTSWGVTGEYDAYKNLVDRYAAPGAVFASVIDSYSTFGAIDIYADRGLLDTVRDRGATIVLRPDSGDPLTMPVEVIKYLMTKSNVGFTINSKGYKVLPNHVRVIQGDGIDIRTLPIILDNMIKAGLSIDNIAFGMGGGMLQQVDRSNYEMAMKCSSAVIDGIETDVYKDPITDPGKRSKRGKITLVRSDNMQVLTKRVSEVLEGDVELLRVVYHNKPETYAFENFETIRLRAAKFL